METKENQPHFRFNPRAYEPGRAFEPSDRTCDHCSRPCIWEHKENVYALEEATLCARCIAAGGLEMLLGGDYSFHDVEIDGADPDLEAEVLKRTPGVACFNPFEWPVVDGTPLAFLGYGEDESLLAIAEVETAMTEAFDEMGWDFGPSPYALIFKEIDGPLYRVAIDLD